MFGCMQNTQIFSFFSRRAGVRFGPEFFLGLAKIQTGHAMMEVLSSVSKWRVSEEDLDLWFRDLEALEKLGAKILSPVDPDYPQALLGTAEPPVCLSYLGAPVWNQAPGLSIVGTREPSYEAIDWMEASVGPALASQSVVVISGAARGIDSVAHDLAVRYNRPTVALIPSGLAEIYPKQFRSKMDDILGRGGAVLSEYPPNERMQKVYFHERNRLISGMSRIVLVVQAKIRSGSLITAYHAIRQGRSVAVVPWSPLDPLGGGTNQLLFDGASMVRDRYDLEGLIRLEITH